jgi:hypothetical protein
MERGSDALAHDRRYVHPAQKLGVHWKAHALWKIDRRTKQAAYLRRVREELNRHIGANPSIIDKMLVDRACMLSLRLVQIDRMILEERPLTDIDTRMAVSWQNALVRTLNSLRIPTEAAAGFQDSMARILDEVRG